MLCSIWALSTRAWRTSSLTRKSVNTPLMILSTALLTGELSIFLAVTEAHGCDTRPSAVAPPNACQYEFGLIQKSLPLPSGDPRSRDVECLNLNITVPGGELDTTSSGLPVFVFIHGGGFMHGSNAWPQYDQARIVKLSYDLGMSVIGVGIKYSPWCPTRWPKS